MSEPLENLFEISGYAKLYSELYQNHELWDAVESLWSAYFESIGNAKQIIQFIVTIVHEPKLLIFDEPFSGFDPINTDILKKEILTLKEKGASVIFSTHNMESVEEVCDNIALINKSKKILDGKVSDIKNQFKTHIFEIVFEGNFNKFSASLTADYKILDNVQKENKSTLRVSLSEGKNPNDLLTKMLQFGNIISFNELIPSMHDVFIKAVNGNN